MRLNTKQICDHVGGTILVEPIDASALVCGITWDSREVKEGDLFVALEGENQDGHDFVYEVLSAGAFSVLVERRPSEQACTLAREMGASLIEVSNTYTAVTDLARAWRGFLRGRVIGVTGSTGKTTTKELIKQVLSAEHSVVGTQGNQNNELGVPRTILSADPETEYIVVEMGMRGSGQITELCDFVRPDMGVITNIGDSHIELLGSRDGIAQAKAELMECLPPSTGAIFLNASDEYTDVIAQQAKDPARNLTVVRYDGSGDLQIEADVSVENPYLDEQGKPHFTLVSQAGKANCALNLRGYHNIFNAAAAAAVGLQIGMDIDQVVEALALAEPVAGRQKIEKNRDGVIVVDDSYNASPDSMRAALRTFVELKVDGRRVAVLGDMGELGDHAQACHEDIGRYVAELKVDELVCIGELSQSLSRAAQEAGMSADVIRHCGSIGEILGELEGSVGAGDAVLVKASHSVGLERVVRGLLS